MTSPLDALLPLGSLILGYRINISGHSTSSICDPHPLVSKRGLLFLL